MVVAKGSHHVLVIEMLLGDNEDLTVLASIARERGKAMYKYFRKQSLTTKPPPVTFSSQRK